VVIVEHEKVVDEIYSESLLVERNLDAAMTERDQLRADNVALAKQGDDWQKRGWELGNELDAMAKQLEEAHDALCKAIHVLMRPEVIHVDAEVFEARMACMRAQDSIVAPVSSPAYAEREREAAQLAAEREREACARRAVERAHDLGIPADKQRSIAAAIRAAARHDP
jgi:hypothetical protein